jgi:histidyl-tRNA synthetase
MKYQKIRGCDDILPPEVEAWQELEEKAVKILTLFGYQEIRTPLIEPLELFQRSIGESTDIVEKELFSFQDKKGRNICLRPEATASVARAYVENNLFQLPGVKKFYYLGPMFRAERPQKGRKRQFHQIGVEAIGSYRSEIDAEVIYLAYRLIKALGIEEFHLELNTLGCLKDKGKISGYIKKKISRYLDKFCQQCQKRYQRNVLRILDCKNPGCIEVIKNLNLDINSQICGECKQHYSELKDYLKSLHIEFVENPSLVRGLDYYTRTVFEILSPGLGAQNAVAAGGRYDNLIQEIGGPSCGAVGFALGMERILLLKGKTRVLKYQPSVFIAVQDKALVKQALIETMRLRENEIPVEMDYQGRSLKSQMRLANEKEVKYVLILGVEEMQKGEYTLKDMSTGIQKSIKREEIIKVLKEG